MMERYSPVDEPDGLYIYVHVPVCTGRCGYCDFYSTVPTDAPPADVAGEVLRLAAAELELWRKAHPAMFQLPTRSVFFGGGTPSLAMPEDFASFLQCVRELAMCDDVRSEITLETQPGTCDYEKIGALISAGVRRFSVGVQSFSDEHLRLAGRRHSVDDTRRLLSDLRRFSGDCHMSIDLISCWPNQTVAQWHETLDEALSYKPHHLSIYELTYHANAPFAQALVHGALEQQDEDTRVEIFESTVQKLDSCGFEHYEISSFARGCCRSVHNENYWRLGDFIGVGPGAHSYIHPHRYANPDDLDGWRKCIENGQLARVQVDAEDEHIRVMENLQAALRYLDGVDISLFARRFGRDFLRGHEEQWNELYMSGILEFADTDSNITRLTERGCLMLDSAIERLL